MPVRVEGLARVQRQLHDVGASIDDMKDVMQAISNEGARIAAEFAPKRTGLLAATIRGNRAKRKAVVSAGKKAVPYAGPINYGWPARGIIADEFMQRTDKVIGPWAEHALEEGVKEIIKRNGLS